MTAISIDSVTTGDAAPAAAPHRISGQTTKDVAAIAFTPQTQPALYPSTDLFPSTDLYPRSGAGATVLGVRIVVGGVSPYTGKLVGRKGLPCSEQVACSDALPCSDWSSPTGTQITEDVTFDELVGEADGDKTINVWADINGTWR